MPSTRVHSSSNSRPTRSSSTWWLSLVGLSITMMSSPAPGQAAQSAIVLRPLITEPVDESRLTTLRGNTHLLARPVFDVGTAPATLPLERMLLVLKRSPEQEAALRKLLDDQQDKTSSSCGRAQHSVAFE